MVGASSFYSVSYEVLRQFLLPSKHLRVSSKKTLSSNIISSALFHGGKGVYAGELGHSLPPPGAVSNG